MRTLLLLLLLFLPARAQEPERQDMLQRAEQQMEEIESPPAQEAPAPDRRQMLDRAEQLIEEIESDLVSPPRQGVFHVVAHEYYDTYEERYVPVYSVRIHEKGNWADRVTLWNSGMLTTFEAEKDPAEPGRYYQVEVVWLDGARWVWDYVMRPRGTTVEVWKP
ncbi:MAG: hypothetical protein HY319_00595 [Armatimonadetes bacterium]|nr:hypothetical protein [Armatimonadota bacterium]